jgi:hypothetical protein
LSRTNQAEAWLTWLGVKTIIENLTGIAQFVKEKCQAGNKK